MDGAIARRTGTTTPFGAIADPFADKLLIMSVFLSFASLNQLNIPIWAVYLILLRELTISTLRVLAGLNGVALKAERAGKIKTTIQLTSSFIILVLLILGMWSKVQVLPRVLEYLGSLAGQAGWWLTVITAFFTVISGTIYLYNHRDLIQNQTKGTEGADQGFPDQVPGQRPCQLCARITGFKIHRFGMAGTLAALAHPFSGKKPLRAFRPASCLLGMDSRPGRKATAPTTIPA